MKKPIVILCVLVCVFGSFILFRKASSNSIEIFLSSKCLDETLSIESVAIDIKSMEIVARICDSDGIESTIRKKGSVIYGDYDWSSVRNI